MGLFDKEIESLKDYMALAGKTNKTASSREELEAIPDIAFAKKILQILEQDFDRDTIAKIIFQIEKTQIDSSSYFAAKPVIELLLNKKQLLLFHKTYPDIAETMDVKGQMLLPTHSSFTELLMNLQQSLFSKYQCDSIFQKHKYSKTEIEQSSLQQELTQLAAEKKTGTAAIVDFNRSVKIIGYETQNKENDVIIKAVKSFTNQNDLLTNFLLNNGGQILSAIVTIELNRTTHSNNSAEKVMLNQHKGELVWSKDPADGFIIGTLKLFCTTAKIGDDTYVLDKENKLTAVPPKDDSVLTQIGTLNYSAVNQTTSARPFIKTENNVVPIIASAELKIKLTEKNGEVKVSILDFEKYIYTDELKHGLPAAPNLAPTHPPSM